MYRIQFEALSGSGYVEHLFAWRHSLVHEASFWSPATFKYSNGRDMSVH